MKIQSCEIHFEGTLPELVEWLHNTFRNPEDVKIVGTIHPKGPKAPPEHLLIQVMKKRCDRLLTEKQADEIVTLLRRGMKIAAIKATREFSGLGLKDAKDFVECSAVQDYVARELP